MKTSNNLKTPNTDEIVNIGTVADRTVAAATDATNAAATATASGNSSAKTTDNNRAKHHANTSAAGEIVLEITGMHCAACRASVLAAAESVGARADVDLLGARGYFTGASAEELIAAINRAGFGAKLLSQRAQMPIWPSFAAAGFALAASLCCLALPFWPAALLCAAAVAAAAGKFIAKALFHRGFGMDLLITLGIFINYSFSFLLPHSYFFECAFIAFIVALGKALEAAAKRYAAGLLRPSAPPSARLASGRIIPASELSAGDVLQLGAGEILHTDARLLNAANFDLSVASGESLPVFLRAGQTAPAGAAALDPVRAQALCAWSESSLARLVAEAERASAKSAPEYGWIDVCARYFSAVIITIAAVVGAAWWIAANAEQAAFYAASVLLISCPCALGLAVPMSVSAAVALAFARGVVVKNSAILLAEPAVLACDKTGTLTALKAELVGFCGRDLRVFLAVQAQFAHPISAAILAAADTQKPAGDDAEKSLPELAAKSELLGTCLRYSGLADGEHTELATESTESGFIVRINSREAGRVRLFGELLPGALELCAKRDVMVLSGDAAPAVSACAASIAQTARRVDFAARTSPKDKAQFIRHLRAGLPADPWRVDLSAPSAAAVRAQLAGAKTPAKSDPHGAVIYFGDGANDLATVRAADFVIAKASGHAALAARAAAVVPGPKAAAELLEIGAAMRRKIRANLIISFIYNFFGILFASGIFALLAGICGDLSGDLSGSFGAASSTAASTPDAPAFAAGAEELLRALAGVNLHLNPALCAALMCCSSLVVVGNSLLLLRKKFAPAAPVTDGADICAKGGAPASVAPAPAAPVTPSPANSSATAQNPQASGERAQQ